MPGSLTFDEMVQCQEVIFEWAESYDTKDWERLSHIMAPEIEIDYTEVNNINTTISASSFRTMISGPGFLGDPLIRTQHFIGATKWEKISSTLIEGHHQLRTTHHRFAEPIRGNNSEGAIAPIKVKSHVYAKFRYVNVDGDGNGEVWSVVSDGMMVH